MSDAWSVFDDWDLDPSRRWYDWFDWLAPRRWGRRPRTQIRNGYECQFDYKTSRWQFTHRLVAEAALGGPIPSGYEVHHINGNKRDNSPSNLAVIPKDLHRAIHAVARAAAEASRSNVNALIKAMHEMGTNSVAGSGSFQAKEYVIEPTPKKVLWQIIPRLLEMELYHAVLESNASQESARMMAMRNATDAAKDMVSDLTLAYNQLRQGKITQEIAELSAGMAAVQK